jgi:FkbM family methyltransferase
VNQTGPHGYRLKRVLSRVLSAVLGRRNLVRLARFLLDEARLDIPNVMASNGERLVQRMVLETTTPREITAFDVGAHVGDWTASLLALADRFGFEVRVHAFEPSRIAFERLKQRFGQRSAGRVRAVHAALSDRAGAGILHMVGDFALSNSLYPPLHGEPVDAEEVPLITLDGYCSSEGIDRIDLVKIDAEGHDLAILSGAGALLSSRRIEVVQFEYNYRWIAARAFLRDAFELLAGFGYRVGKVTPSGIEFYGRWDPELETYREGNYLACLPERSGHFPVVRWWKEAR